MEPVYTCMNIRLMPCSCLLKINFGRYYFPHTPIRVDKTVCFQLISCVCSIRMCEVSFELYCMCVCLPQRLLMIGLKWIVILVFEYSFSFQMNSPNILLNIRSSKMTSIFWQNDANFRWLTVTTLIIALKMNASCPKISRNGRLQFNNLVKFSI